MKKQITALLITFTILLSGAAGFTGTYLANNLAAMNAPVYEDISPLENNTDNEWSNEKLNAYLNDYLAGYSVPATESEAASSETTNHTRNRRANVKQRR